jgi:hypothetical protein
LKNHSGKWILNTIKQIQLIISLFNSTNIWVIDLPQIKTPMEAKQLQKGDNNPKQPESNLS